MIMKACGKHAVETAARILRKKGLVIYPTETAYGIAADATSLSAISKIMKLKKRTGKFIPVIVADARMAEKYFSINKETRKLMRKFMPGPLTLTAEKKKMRTAKMLGGFRIPANRFALALVKKFGRPITATSANISGNPQIYNAGKIKQEFSGKVNMIIDAGSLPRRKPSTVFDVRDKKILRKGKIKLKDIMKAL